MEVVRKILSGLASERDNSHVWLHSLAENLGCILDGSEKVASYHFGPDQIFSHPFEVVWEPALVLGCSFSANSFKFKQDVKQSPLCCQIFLFEHFYNFGLFLFFQKLLPVSQQRGHDLRENQAAQLEGQIFEEATQFNLCVSVKLFYLTGLDPTLLVYQEQNQLQIECLDYKI